MSRRARRPKPLHPAPAGRSRRVRPCLVTGPGTRLPLAGLVRSKLLPSSATVTPSRRCRVRPPRGMGVRLRACPLPARCRCPKASVRGLGDSLARPVRRPEGWRRCMRDRRRFRCPPRRAAWRRRFAASRRRPEGRRRSVAFRSLRVRGFRRGCPPSEKGLLPRFPLLALDIVPPPYPDPRVGSGCGVAARSVTSKLPSGFLPKKGAFVTSVRPPSGRCLAAFQ